MEKHRPSPEFFQKGFAKRVRMCYIFINTRYSGTVRYPLKK